MGEIGKQAAKAVGKAIVGVATTIIPIVLSATGEELGNSIVEKVKGKGKKDGKRKK